MHQRVVSRRAFLKESFAAMGEAAVDLLEGDTGKDKGMRFLRPPGAVEEISFLELCTRCGHCINACPFQSIQRAQQKDIADTPILLPKERPCYLCNDLPCINACSTGALRPLQREEVKMGTALIHESLCLAYHDQDCLLCMIQCPLQGDAIYWADSRPVIRKEKCAGCGVCEQACSTINTSSAIRIIPYKGGNEL